MGRRHESARKWPAPRLGLALGLLLLAGCESLMGRGGFDGDPLTGGPPIPRALATNQPAAVAATTPANPLPSLPAPASTTSPAALTGGGANPSLDPGRDLRIGAGLGNPAPTPAPGYRQTTNPPSGAVLHTPQPVSDGAFQQTGSVQPQANNAGMAAPAAGRVDTYQQLQDALNARGVTWRRLETTVADSGEWKFSCSVPSAQNPNLRHVYEALGPTDLSAMRAALEKIDRERRPPG